MKPVLGVLHDFLYASTVLLPKLIKGTLTGQFSEHPYYPLHADGTYHITDRFPTEHEGTNEGTISIRPLVIAVHGLQGHPVVWNGYVNQLKERIKGCEFFVPYVKDAGNCALEDAVAPIHNAIRSLTPGQRRHNPVFIIGTSNGARIASRLEVVLRDHCTDVTVVSIAGLHHGTSLVNLLQDWAPLRFISRQVLVPSVLDEMGRDSEHATELLRQVNATPPDDVRRDYHVFVSHCDTRIFPAGHVPEITHTKGATVYSYQGHNSIVNRALPEIVDIIVSAVDERAREGETARET